MRLLSLLSSFCLSSLLVTAAFTFNSSTFNPHDLIALPRVSGSIASPSGSHLLTSVSQSGNTTLYLTDLARRNDKDGYEHVIVRKGTGESVWLGDEMIAFLEGDELRMVEVSKGGKVSSPTTLLTFPTTVSNLQYEPTSHILAFTAFVYPDGDLDSVKKQDKAYENRGDQGQLYDELFVRHWDEWRGPKSSSIFIVNLKDIVSHAKSTAPHFVNLLKDTDLASPSPDALSDYHLSPTHLVFSAKDPNLNPAYHTRRNIYLVPLSRSPSSSSIAEPIRSLTAGEPGQGGGATSSPKISPDGKKIAWLEMAIDGYEADRNRVMVWEIAEGKGNGKSMAEEWDRSPGALNWFPNSSALLLTAPSCGRDQLFTLPVSLDSFIESRSNPFPLSLPHSSSAPQLISTPNSKSLSITYTSSSLASPPETFLFDLSSPHSKPHQITNFTTTSSILSHHKPALSQGEEIYFDGADGVRIQGWVVKPPGFEKGGKAKEWPMAFLIHGGPQGAWEDSWSWRWNPNVFAQQGYVVVAINPTGSTSFGQKLTDDIQNNWGGRPYHDLLAGLKYALKIMPEIDPERLVALGASYGGYMINWIQGQPNNPFAAMVCHDGIFDVLDAYYSTEELYFIEQSHGFVLPWEDKERYERWNPANHIANWATPQLVIHSGKDYRLGEQHGLSAFTALQRKAIPSRFLYFSNENHWVLSPGNSLKWHFEVLRWMDEWVGKGRREKEQKREGMERLVIQV